MLVAIGSDNPVKVDSVHMAFNRVWPDHDWDFRSCEAKSGVRDQPMSNAEARKGARQRATIALSRFDAQFGVGIEGGLHLVDGRWFNSAWVVVLDQYDTEGMSGTTSVAVPEVLMDRVDGNHELGKALDGYLGAHNTKHQGGLVGFMTNHVLDRTSVYADAVVAALAVFLQPNIFAQHGLRGSTDGVEVGPPMRTD